MRYTAVLAALAFATCGCVTAPLENYTVNQSLSISDMRYQEVMNALAMVAHNRGTLPSYSVTAGGVANVTASVSLESTTGWTRIPENFGSQILTLMGSHSPDLSWSLDPVAEPILLRGAWYACCWAVDGPPSDPAVLDLLRKPTVMDTVACGAKPTYHLGIIDDNHPIPCGWLCVGPRRCVPRTACYKANCGDTYVWVMPEGLHDLSDFTLMLLDIATTDPAWLAQQQLQPTAAVVLTLPGSADGKSTITETWTACQQIQAGGSTKIAVVPFADPMPETASLDETANYQGRNPQSYVIEKSTLDLNAGGRGTAAMTDLPGYVPVPGAAASTYSYRGGIPGPTH